jgi:hypothetical protein
MNVDDTAVEPGDYTRGHQSQISGQDNHVNVTTGEDSREVILRSRIEHERIDSRDACALKRASASPIRRNKHDFATCGVAQCGEVIQ